MPAASAILTAKAVGAETATIIGPRIAADFCTISTDTRLVRTIIPVAPWHSRERGRRRAYRTRYVARRPPAQPPSPSRGAKSPRRAPHESHDLGPVVERVN